MRPALAIALGVQGVSTVLSFLFPSSAPYLGVVSGILTIYLLALVGAKRQERLVEEKIAERTNNLREMMTVYEKQASTDALTGLLNRRGGEAMISHHANRAKSSGASLSFLLVDIDYFKSINDQYGHAVGDIVITTVANCMRDSIRQNDFAVRWGGEEYLVCLPDTDLLGAAQAAEKLRKNIERIEGNQTPSVTVSVGCAELGDDTFHVAIARADMALYMAKTSGRNQVFPIF